MGHERAAEPFLRAVTDFIYVSDPPRRSDAIFVPGSAHPEHVLLAARMYREGWAPVIVPSGRYAIGTEGFTADPRFATEWAWMRDLLLREGVPDAAILREDEATYTWQNAQNSRAVCERAGLTVSRGMLCCTPWHARRALFYYQAAFPDTEWAVCPAEVDGMGRDAWYRTPEGRALVLGEVRRLGSQIGEVLEDLLEDMT